MIGQRTALGISLEATEAIIGWASSLSFCPLRVLLKTTGILWLALIRGEAGLIDPLQAGEAGLIGPLQAGSLSVYPRAASRLASSSE